MYSDLLVFATNSGKELAKKICRNLQEPLAKAKISRFADGEVDVKLLESVRGKDVFIIAPTHSPARNRDELKILTDAIRRSGAGRKTLVIPYLSYNRQERKEAPRRPISAKVIINEISKLIPDGVLLLDLHSEATMGFFDDSIIVDQLYASIELVPYIQDHIIKGCPQDFVFVSPDVGGSKRAVAYCNRLDLLVDDLPTVAICYKERPRPGLVDEKRVIVIGIVLGKKAIIVDDMLDSGNSIIAVSKALIRAGAVEVCVVVTHPIFSKGAIRRLDNLKIDGYNGNPIKEIIVTDSIHRQPRQLKMDNVKLTVFSMSHLLAEAIKRIHNGDSLSDLFLEKPH